MGIERKIFGTLSKLDVSGKCCQTEDLVKREIMQKREEK